MTGLANCGRSCAASPAALALAAAVSAAGTAGATALSIKRFVRTTRRYRTIQIQAGALTAADPLPDDLRSALASIHGPAGGAL